MTHKFEKWKEYHNISQRVLFGFRFAYSPFTPVKSESATQTMQKEWHDIMGLLIQRLYDDPSLLNLPTSQDEHYPWEKCNNQMPALDKIYMSIFKGLHAFYRFLFVIGQHGNIHGNSIHIQTSILKTEKVSVKTSFAPLLALLKIDLQKNGDEYILTYPHEDGVFHALKVLVDESLAFDINNRFHQLHSSLFNFAMCAYSCEYSYIIKRLETLYDMEEHLLQRLEEDCLHRGYQKIAYGGFSTTGFDFSIKYKNQVGGFIIGYNPRKFDQFHFGTINTIGVKAMLEDFEHLDTSLQVHFMENCKRCNGCNGCTKGGKSKVFAVKFNVQGEDILLCPMFPRSSWRTLDTDRINVLVTYHDLQEKFVL